METRAHNSRRYESISKVSTGFVREIEELDKALERQGYSVEISLYDAGLAEFWMNDGECKIVIRSRDDAERYEIIAWHFPNRYDHTHTTTPISTAPMICSSGKLPGTSCVRSS